MKRILAALSLALLSAILIIGCDGGDEVSDPLNNLPLTSEDSVVLNGMVSIDNPSQGVIQAINTRGETSDEVHADVHGAFSIPIPNYPPFVLRLIHHDQGAELFSFATAAGYVNLTPLTHLAMYVAVGTEMNLDTLFHEWNGSQLSPEEVQMAMYTVNANLASLLRKQGLNDKTYDFFHTNFKPDGTGIDAVLNAIRIHIDPNADTLSRSIHILDASGHQLLPFDAAVPVDQPVASSATGRKKKGVSQ